MLLINKYLSRLIIELLISHAPLFVRERESFFNVCFILFYNKLKKNTAVLKLEHDSAIWKGPLNK